MKLVFNDQSFAFQLLHVMSYVPYQAADIGECLVTAATIKECDFTSWFEAWHQTAKRIEKRGDISLNDKQYVSARSAYLRASNYHRTSGFYLNANPADPRFVSAWGKSCDLFVKAMKLYPYAFDEIAIPFDDGVLPGYFFKPNQSNTPRPTLIALTGFDGTKEELFMQSGFEALSRGYNFICFDGPGQGAVVRQQKLYFRHDWEKVVTPVVDFAVEQPDVNVKQIALMGVSYGGFLAARAAAFEPRLAALIANDGLYDLYDATCRFGEKSHAANNQTIEQLPTTVQWALAQARWIFQASPEAYIEKLKNYSMKGIASKITCPTLICEAENDHFFKGQPEQIYEALTCPKSYMQFTGEEGAGEHCHVGALTLFNARVFDWLSETLSSA